MIISGQRVAAGVRRRTVVEKLAENPPPHAGGYGAGNSQMRSYKFIDPQGLEPEYGLVTPAQR